MASKFLIVPGDHSSGLSLLPNTPRRYADVSFVSEVDRVFRREHDAKIILNNGQDFRVMSAPEWVKPGAILKVTIFSSGAFKIEQIKNDTA